MEAMPFTSHHRVVTVQRINLAGSSRKIFKTKGAIQRPLRYFN